MSLNDVGYLIEMLPWRKRFICCIQIINNLCTTNNKLSERFCLINNLCDEFLKLAYNNETTDEAMLTMLRSEYNRSLESLKGRGDKMDFRINLILDQLKRLIDINLPHGVIAYILVNSTTAVKIDPQFEDYKYLLDDDILRIYNSIY